MVRDHASPGIGRYNGDGVTLQLLRNNKLLKTREVTLAGDG